MMLVLRDHRVFGTECRYLPGTFGCFALPDQLLLLLSSFLNYDLLVLAANTHVSSSLRLLLLKLVILLNGRAV